MWAHSDMSPEFGPDVTQLEALVIDELFSGWRYSDLEGDRLGVREECLREGDEDGSGREGLDLYGREGE